MRHKKVIHMKANIMVLSGISDGDEKHTQQNHSGRYLEGKKCLEGKNCDTGIWKPVNLVFEIDANSFLLTVLRP